MALAAQRYGIIVRDQTHKGTSFFAEDPTQFGGRDVYYGPHGFFGAELPVPLLADFPWSHLQVLEMHLCSRTPCEK